MLVRIFVPWIVLAAILGFVLGGSYIALGQTPAEQQTERPSDNKAPAEAQPPTVSQPHAQQQAPGASNGEQTVKDHVIEFFNVKLTDVLITIFTLVLAWKTSGLFTETAGLRSAADQQAADMKAAIAASEETAKAATSQARTAERALTELERPYIFVWDLKGEMPVPFNAPRGGKTLYPPATFTFAVSNQGNLAAVIEDVHIAWGYERNGLFPPLIQIGDHQLIQKRIMASRIDVPGVSHKVDLLRLDGSACDGTFHEGLIFRVVIKYRGAFTKGHETSQCWKCMRTTALSGFYEVSDERYTYMR